MYFSRDLYLEDANYILPSLEKIERIYEILLKYPSWDEVRFLKTTKRVELAENADRETAVLHLLLEMYNWLKFFLYTNVYKPTKLTEGLIEAYNSKNHLVWTILARSIAEYSAIFYYYKRKIDQLEIRAPAFKSSQLQSLEALMIQYVHGSRFNWQDLLSGNTEALKKNFIGTAEQPKAVNVLTALSHLSKRDQRFADVELTYAMLSDFVHPNMGSHTTVLDTLSDLGEVQAAKVTLSPNESRGAFIAIFTVPIVHMHLSNILELALETARPLARWVDMIEGKEHTTIHFGA